MTHLSQHLLLAPALGLLQPGCIAWLHAVGSHRAQPAARSTAQPARVAHTQPSHTVPTALHARSGEGSAEPKPLQRIGNEARYVRRWLQPRLPELCEAVLRSALGGDMEATRLLLRMGGLDGRPEAQRKKPTKTGPGFAKKAMDEFRAR